MSPLAEGESMKGSGGALGGDVEHDANPETALGVTGTLVEAK